MNMPRYLYYYITLNNKNFVKNELPNLENLKKEYINYLLKITGNNISQTAAILNISRQTLYNKITKLPSCKKNIPYN